MDNSLQRRRRSSLLSPERTTRARASEKLCSSTSYVDYFFSSWSVDSVDAGALTGKVEINYGKLRELCTHFTPNER